MAGLDPLCIIPVLQSNQHYHTFRPVDSGVAGLDPSCHIVLQSKPINISLYIRIVLGGGRFIPCIHVIL